MDLDNLERKKGLCEKKEKLQRHGTVGALQQAEIRSVRSSEQKIKPPPVIHSSLGYHGAIEKFLTHGPMLMVVASMHTHVAGTHYPFRSSASA